MIFVSQSDFSSKYPFSFFKDPQNFLPVQIVSTCKQQKELCIKNLICVGMAEIIVRIEENAVYEHFPLLPK